MIWNSPKNGQGGPFYHPSASAIGWAPLWIQNFIDLGALRESKLCKRLVSPTRTYILEPLLVHGHETRSPLAREDRAFVPPRQLRVLVLP